jgi:hypothetical protein
MDARADREEIEPGITIDVDMHLIAQIPVDPDGAREELRIPHPFPLVAIGVALAHLHGLGIDGTAGEQLHLLRQVGGHLRPQPRNLSVSAPTLASWNFPVIDLPSAMTSKRKGGGGIAKHGIL